MFGHFFVNSKKNNKPFGKGEENVREKEVVDPLKEKEDEEVGGKVIKESETLEVSSI